MTSARLGYSKAAVEQDGVFAFIVHRGEQQVVHYSWLALHLGRHGSLPPRQCFVELRVLTPPDGQWIGGRLTFSSGAHTTPAENPQPPLHVAQGGPLVMREAADMAHFLLSTGGLAGPLEEMPSKVTVLRLAHTDETMHVIKTTGQHATDTPLEVSYMQPANASRRQSRRLPSRTPGDDFLDLEAQAEVAREAGASEPARRPAEAPRDPMEEAPDDEVWSLIMDLTGSAATDIFREEAPSDGDASSDAEEGAGSSSAEEGQQFAPQQPGEAAAAASSSAAVTSVAASADAAAAAADAASEAASGVPAAGGKLQELPNWRFARADGTLAGQLHCVGSSSLKASCRQHARCTLWVNCGGRHDEAEQLLLEWLALEGSKEQHFTAGLDVKRRLGMRPRRALQ